MDIVELSENLGLKKTEFGYSGVYTTGQFDELCDYDAGLLEVKIKALPRTGDKWIFHFSLCTVDDGGWGAWDTREDYTREEVDARVEQVYELFMSKMGNSKKLPKASTLNKWFRTIGLYGVHTG